MRAPASGSCAQACANIRFAAEGAKFTTAFARRGLIAEHGLSWSLPRIVGTANALDLLMSGRVFLAEEAAELGFVNKVLPADELMDYTMAYTRDMVDNAAPASWKVMKWQVYRHIDTDVDTALTESNKLMAESLTRPDFKEGVASFVEKRLPNFEPVVTD